MKLQNSLKTNVSLRQNMATLLSSSSLLCVQQSHHARSWRFPPTTLNLTQWMRSHWWPQIPRCSCIHRLSRIASSWPRIDYSFSPLIEQQSSVARLNCWYRWTCSSSIKASTCWLVHSLAVMVIWYPARWNHRVLSNSLIQESYLYCLLTVGCKSLW